jgi:hypothetical protein
MDKKLITFIYYIPNVSSQSSRATITFHPSTHKFYTIWILDFSQVYILDLPLLLTQKNYLNYL